MLYTKEEAEDYLKWESYKKSLASKLLVWSLILWVVFYLITKLLNLNWDGWCIWLLIFLVSVSYYIYYKKMDKYINHSKFNAMFYENLRLNEWWHNLTLFEKKEIKER